MLPPHKLDDVFTKPHPVPQNGHVIIKEAIEAANAAFEKAVEDKSGKAGPSPAQYARQAFLDALDAAPVSG